MNYTTFEDIYAKFLSKITDYDLASTHADDFQFILENFLSGAIGLYFSGQLKPRVENINFEEKHFGTELTLTEQWMLATAMVYQWLDTKLYKERLMMTAITDRDYNETSPANQLRAMRLVKEDLELELHKYDVEYGYKDIGSLS